MPSGLAQTVAGAICGSGWGIGRSRPQAIQRAKNGGKMVMTKDEFDAIFDRIVEYWWDKYGSELIERTYIGNENIRMVIEEIAKREEASCTHQHPQF